MFEYTCKKKQSECMFGIVQEAWIPVRFLLTLGSV